MASKPDLSVDAIVHKNQALVHLASLDAALRGSDPNACVTILRDLQYKVFDFYHAAQPQGVIPHDE